MGGDTELLTTVLVPVWDEYSPWLTQAVGSLQQQDVATRIVVVNNASRVELPELDGVSVMSAPRRLPLGSARNLGLTEVNTPYVVVWDADDVMLPGTLAFLQGEISSDPGLAAFASAIVEEPSGRRHRWPRPWVTGVARFPAVFALLDCVWSVYPTTGATIMRTDFVRSAGGYSDADSGDDWCLGVSLAFRGRLGWSERPGRMYRLHVPSITSRYMTVRYLVRHAKAVRERIRRDPGIAGWARSMLPLIAIGQHVAVAAHVPVSAARRVLHAATARSRRSGA